MRLPFSVVFLIFIAGQLSGQDLTYPKTIKRTVVNRYGPFNVKDEYQWLEQIERPEVKIWIEAQNEVSTKYLQRSTNRTNSENLMNQYMFRKNNRAIWDKINFDKDHQANYKLYYPDQFSTPSIYYRENNFNDYRLLVDSRYISKDDRIFIQHFRASQKDDYLAYQYSRNGSDWGEIKVVSTEDYRHPSEVIRRVKFSQIHWKNDGFFYKKYPFDSITGTNLSPKIYYHKLYTKPEEDSLVFSNKNPSNHLVMFSTFREDMYVIGVEAFSGDRFSYFFCDPNSKKPVWKPLFYGISSEIYFVDFKNGAFIAKTNLDGQDQLISFTADSPKSWNVLTPSYKDFQITGYELIEDKTVITYQNIDRALLVVVDDHGELLKEIPMPPGVAISNLSFQKETNEFYFFLQSYTIPPVICKLDLEELTYDVVERTGVNFDFEEYKYEVRYFPARDSTLIPMFITYKGQLSKDSDTPVLLSAYGGFGVISQPRYDPEAIYFLEQGGVFGYVYTRGGGELGLDWWKAGKNLNKINSVNDFVDAAKYLMDQGYTRKGKIAIKGSSHGGLLSSAAMIQEPSLFGAVVINVGVTDMLRFNKFTVGPFHEDEFGSPFDSTEFRSIAQYSPYHKASDYVNYPPMLIITGQSDDRVPPFHSYKFAAKLQNNPSQKNPVVLWSQEQAGHSGSSDLLGRLEQKSFVSAFLKTHLFEDN